MEHAIEQPFNRLKTLKVKFISFGGGLDFLSHLKHRMDSVENLEIDAWTRTGGSNGHNVLNEIPKFENLKTLKLFVDCWFHC